MQDVLDTLARDFGAGFGATPWPTAALRMAAALVFGGLIGLEREVSDKSAGLRTHMLIALAACLFTLIGFEMVGFPVGPAEDTLRLDPLRLIEAVTAGVAFLAAGTIITNRDRVRGLTTGAGMWLAGAVGLASGFGRIGLALMATVFALIVLWMLRRLERRGRD